MMRPRVEWVSAKADPSKTLTSLIQSVVGGANRILSELPRGGAAAATPQIPPLFSPSNVPVPQVPQVPVQPFHVPPPVAAGPEIVRPVLQAVASGTPTKVVEEIAEIVTPTPVLSNVRRAESAADKLREETLRAEQAKKLREVQLRIEKMHEMETERQLREEMDKKRIAMLKRMEELREADKRSRVLLEEQRRISEERARVINEKQAALQFAQMETSTIPLPSRLTTPEQPHIIHPSSRPIVEGVANPQQTLHESPEETTPQISSSVDSSSSLRYRLRPAQCAAINKFTRVFKIDDPSDWVNKNCQFAKKYFPQASCPQIQALIESCFALRRR
ncbi:hypothetical protein PFISCL1PPCAC_28510 [Pristionchus fissidentatus]|uniref:aECM cysteine-cradle domain-containing protein n=1 Tax=Pristionchus fissidentatus TaxID=1538716 RepID=A0AAV5X3B2_9BILA|nr:hypothetical protein PFISCL1PPCAC_28510 [Pristionchus fissidentatus]